MNDSLPRTVRTALLSVSDKRGLEPLARALVDRGVTLLSTGGTFAALARAGVSVQEVSAHTGFPEIMNGRVKTLHPKIHGGILGRREQDAAVMSAHGIEAIDLVVVNLYPFAETVARAEATPEEVIENIDIGGPAMVRSAAKNHRDVLVVVDPGDYAEVIEVLASGHTDLALRERYAAKAFRHTAAYDATVAAWFASRAAATDFPESLTLTFTKRDDMRYGENPHQSAAFYVEQPLPRGTVAAAEQVQGKELSFNNVADADAALECVKAFELPACVIVKHANPCGVSEGDDVRSAYERAFATDPTSAFGGIVAFNRPLDGPTLEAVLERQFVEVVLAPEIDPAAVEVARRKKNVRLLRTGAFAASTVGLDFKRVRGGVLVQSMDALCWRPEGLEVVSARAPTDAELVDLEFAWKVAWHVKSNAIVYARDRQTIGVGAGQMSRVVSAKIAGLKAAEEGLEVRGSVMASDAFFPFRDGIDTAAAAGITAVIQPGGSMRDDEVIAAADEHGMAMVFTGVRHFRH